MISKKIIKIITWIIALLLFTQLAVAIGIRPAKTIMVHEESPDFSGTIWVVNNDHIEFKMDVYTQGALSEYIKLKKKTLNFKETDEAQAVDFEINLPDEIPPGEFNNFIIFDQELKNTNEENVISSKLLLKHRVVIISAYPDKFITVKVNSFEQPEKLRLVSEVENLGKQDIESIQTTFYVDDKEQNQQILETEETSLMRSENKLLSADINKDIFGEGEFEVSAVTTYDDLEIELIKTFQIGRPDVDITYFNKYFIANKINEYDLDLLNLWNKEIKRVFVDVDVKKDGEKIDEFRTKSVDIEGQMTERISDYFDAKEKNPGRYTFEMEVNFWNSQDMETKIFQSELLTENEFNRLGFTGASVGQLGTGSIIGLMVLVCLLTGAIIFFVLKRNPLIKKKDQPKEDNPENHSDERELKL